MNDNIKLSVVEMNRLTQEEFKQQKKIPLVIVLDNVRSMNNIGSVFRTADAFLVDALYLCGITATPPHRDIRKTALGAEDSVLWRYFESTSDAVAHLKEQGYHLLALEQTQNSIPLQEIEKKLKELKEQPLALVIGHEVKGVDQEIVNMCDGAIEIPQFGTKHSLNVSVAAGMSIWEIAKYYMNRSV
ncbi:RNA methyltransferase [Porphyromonas canoris]|uniref:RNA methyltransferase n=1 Tax=Porphyromonas canoris TaxID=36875 RepID=A0ABR4XIS1_9PORP|nr:RNA methyltransferase [Porphyromonas canoris]KGL50841.1 RNA methyltransferase [Porphyromonas canoris]KGN91600.1 RNA methyltransferase [Porphyromonas canoris]